MSTEPAKIPSSIDSAYYAINREIARRLAEQGYGDVRPAHGKVFETIGGGRTLTEMAERAGVTKQAMGELVRHLERGGYLERAPHQEDRRARPPSLTARGRGCVEAARRVLDELHTEWERDLGPGRVRTLERLLGKLLSSLGEQRSGPGEPGAGTPT